MQSAANLKRPLYAIHNNKHYYNIKNFTPNITYVYAVSDDNI